MTWKAFVSAVGQLTIALITAGVISFTGLNMLVQCETWKDSACVTPVEFFSLFTGEQGHDENK